MASCFRSPLLFVSLFLCLAEAGQAWPKAASPEALYFPQAVAEIQAARENTPLWVTSSGWTPMGRELLGAINSAEAEGLNSADYHSSELEPFAATVAAPGYTQQQIRQSHLKLEKLLTDAFLRYALDLSGHRASALEMPEKWVRPEPAENALQNLIQVLSDSRGDLELDRFRPSSPEYKKLCRALNEEQARMKREQPSLLVDGPALKPGQVSPRVFHLRERLKFWGDLNPTPLSLLLQSDLIGASTFDPSLVDVVKNFQARHGLEADGIVGTQTLMALNRSPGKNVAQIRLNLERLRWLPRHLGHKHIRVNIPDFSLSVFQDGVRLFSTRAIVGKQKRPTPILSGKIASLVVNPYWNVPQKLAREDLLPRVRKDPGYLLEKKFTVFKDWVPGAAALDLNLIEWDSIQPWDMAFKFQQKPGPQNPLGQVKFNFVNPFSVYLHDTNHKIGFNQNKRTLSSGCVRIENPLELANLLMNSDEGPSVVSTQFEDMLESGENGYLRLQEAVPVHLMYLTSWVDEEGVLNFREDIYGYDGPMMMALEGEGLNKNEEMLARAESEPGSEQPTSPRFTNSELALYPHE